MDASTRSFHVYGKTASGAGALKGSRDALSTTARRLLILVDGSRTVDELAGMLGRETVDLALAELESLGHVELLRRFPDAGDELPQFDPALLDPRAAARVEPALFEPLSDLAPYDAPARAVADLPLAIAAAPVAPVPTADTPAPAGARTPAPTPPAMPAPAPAPARAAPPPIVRPIPAPLSATPTAAPPVLQQPRAELRPETHAARPVAPPAVPPVPAAPAASAPSPAAPASGAASSGPASATQGTSPGARPRIKAVVWRPERTASPWFMALLLIGAIAALVIWLGAREFAATPAATAGPLASRPATASLAAKPTGAAPPPGTSASASAPMPAAPPPDVPASLRVAPAPSTAPGPEPATAAGAAPAQPEAPAAPGGALVLPASPAAASAPVASTSAPAAAPPSGAHHALHVRNQYTPEIPKPVRDRGINSGHVAVVLHVDPQGRVERVELLSATPPDVYDREMERSFGRWTFDPLGIPGRMTVDVDIRPPQ
jgi:TonB family protein